MTTGERYDITIIQGEAFSLEIAIKDASGNYMNISGYTGYAGIVSRYGDTGILGGIDVNFTLPESGRLTLSIPQTGTSALPVTQGRYEFQLTSPGGVSNKYLNGYATIIPEVINWN